MCIIEQEYKKKLISLIEILKEEKTQKTGEERNVKSQQPSVKHEAVKQSMHECCSETKVW